MKTCQSFLLVSLLLCIVNIGFSQNQKEDLKKDVIIMKNGSTLICKVTKVTDTNIELVPNDKPFLIVSRDAVESILYSDGTLVKLNPAISNTKPVGININNHDVYDESGIKITEASIINNYEFKDVVTITTGNKKAESKELYYFDGERKDSFRIGTVLAWASTLKSNILSFKQSAGVYFQNVQFGIGIIENEKLVFQRVDNVNNFLIGFENNYGKNQNTPEFYEENLPPFAYKGRMLYPRLIFNHSIYYSGGSSITKCSTIITFK
jgi:hypothetical protein